MTTEDGLTPIERHGQIWVKRDDLFQVGGVCGGKVRTCLALARGACGLVTAGGRHSPQVEIVAAIGKHLGLPVRAHVPAANVVTDEIISARSLGAEIVEHRPGYNTVIVARARTDAAVTGYRPIPFGMECIEACAQTASQITTAVSDVGRIVVPVGSGMTLAGILQGLLPFWSSAIGPRVLGVVVGADPCGRLDRYAPPLWRAMVELVRPPWPYSARVDDVGPWSTCGDLSLLRLDPVYEAKCVPFLRAEDLLWVVGRRGILSGGFDI